MADCTAAARRRSSRILALQAKNNDEQSAVQASRREDDPASSRTTKRRVQSTAAERRRTKRGSASLSDSVDQQDGSEVPENGSTSLPRRRENELKASMTELKFVMGIDEAGRGPLAGPVVAAAAVCPGPTVEGIVDSKKITAEKLREELFEKIVASANVRWAVAVVDAPMIDEINILQAAMKAMRMAAVAVVAKTTKELEENLVFVEAPSIERSGCYVVRSGGGTIMNEQEEEEEERKDMDDMMIKQQEDTLARQNYYALVDGNRVPEDMPCPAECMVKGDQREYSIAAASILAKVTRDRLMRGYDRLYPHYDLAKNKGYPTKAHMAAVFKFGASPIHRRTFAPLKHMEFDQDGRVIVPTNDEQNEEAV